MNKIAVPLFILLFGCCYNSAVASALPLQDAIKSGKMTCITHGNEASTHYLEPVLAELSNISGEPLTITIETGDMFIPGDAAKQNIVVTAAETFALNAGEKRIVKIKGICTEQHDGCGTSETMYTFRPGSDAKLKKLADFIASKKYQTTAAQYAVWSLVDNDDLNRIYSADSTEENDLKKFMASLTGKTFAVKSRDYRYNYYTPPNESVGGNFEYSFTKPKDVQIAMFDKNGILVRELFNQKKIAPGDHKLSFQFDSSVYTDDVYYFKLIMGNEVMIDQELNVKSIRDSFKKKIEDGR